MSYITYIFRNESAKFGPSSPAGTPYTRIISTGNFLFIQKCKRIRLGWILIQAWMELAKEGTQPFVQAREAWRVRSPLHASLNTGVAVLKQW